MKRILIYIKDISNVVLYFGGSDFTIESYVDLDYAGDIGKNKFIIGYVFSYRSRNLSFKMAIYRGHFYNGVKVFSSYIS